jgi:DNA invertase Pin-like site-specific DNA recombinase
MISLPGAIYVRQSLTRDGSESMDIQLQACRIAADQLGVTAVAELVEKPSTSGYRNRGKDRAKFNELLALIRGGQIRCVVAYKTDRLSRGGGPGWAPLLEAFENAGVNLDRAVATPGGWVSEFEIGIRATMDREESKKTSERMLEANDTEQHSVERVRHE